MMGIRLNFLMDDKCTCKECGNTHELYGGKGYSVIDFSNVVANTGYIYREYTCKQCGEKYIYKDGV